MIIDQKNVFLIKNILFQKKWFLIKKTFFKEKNTFTQAIPSKLVRSNDRSEVIDVDQRLNDRWSILV